jgi:hypothetical protein
VKRQFVKQRSGRKVMLAGAAVFGGILLGTVAAAAPGVTPGTSVSSSVGTRSDSSPAVVELSDVSDGWRRAFVRLERQTGVNPDAAVAEAASLASFAPTTAPPTTAAPAPVQAAPAAVEAPAPEPEPEPAPAPEPVAAPAPSGAAEEAIAAWFPENYDRAVQIASCESGMNPGAVSRGGGNHGLFQINNVHQGAFESVTGVSFFDGVYNAYYNAQFARHLYDNSGWSPWACA